MKYLKTTFTVTYGNGGGIKDETLLQTAKDILCQLAGTAGFESFEEEGDTVTGYVQKGVFDKGALDDSLSFFPIENVNITYETQEAEDKNWNEAWEETGFEPISVNGKCVIHDTMHRAAVTEGMLDITIDAKQAFGTGTHETTYMIVNRLLSCDLKGKRVLDCGCGTGILSIIAAKLGAESVTGYDIDEWSVDNTRHNCALNGVANVEAVHGDASVIGTMEKSFDLVVANINRNILLDDMPSFKAAMAGNSMLILSGFYGKDAGMLAEKAEGLGLELVGSDTRNDWCMLVFRANA